jgi:hypothetical protein
MLLRSVLVVAAVLAGCTGCTDDSGRAHKVATGTGAPRPQAPEPPGGPPSCAEVAAQLASRVAVAKTIKTEARGAQIEVSGDTLRDGIERGIADVCRSDAWPQNARACALAWEGNVLRDRAGLKAACPGTLR